MYKNLPNDIQQLLNEVKNLQETEYYVNLPISKIRACSWRQGHLEEIIFKFPNLTVDMIYLMAIQDWTYRGMEAKDLIENKKGNLEGTYIDENKRTIYIYRLDANEQFKYYILTKDGPLILSYINFSIKDSLVIHSFWREQFDFDNGYIKDFFIKWFIPKYNLNITNEEVNKLLNNTETNQNNIG